MTVPLLFACNKEGPIVSRPILITLYKNVSPLFMSVIQLDLKIQVQTSGSTQINYNSECISWIILLINLFFYLQN